MTARTGSLILATIARRRAAAVSVSLALALLVAIAVASSASDSQNNNPELPAQSADHYYFQFHGYAENVTINGEPIQPGDTITPILNGTPLKSATVAENGFFSTFRRDHSRPPIGDCNVVYEIESQRHDQPITTQEYAYAKGCGDILVELEIATATSAGTVSEPEAVADDPAQQEDMLEADEQQSDEVEQSDDLMQEQSEAEESEADAKPPTSGESKESTAERQRPDAPRTGTGGLNSQEPKTNWPVVAFIIVGLVLLSSTAVMLANRRTDQSRR